MLGPLAQHEGQPVDGQGRVVADQRRPGGGATKSWCIEGMAASAIEPERGVVDGHVPPAEDLQALLAGQPLDWPTGPASASAGVLGQEGDAGGVVAAGGQVEVDHVARRSRGDLEQDAGPVAAVLLAPGGPPVGQVLEGGEGLAHQAVGGPALQVGHQGDAAGVVLEAGVVEAAVGAAGAHGARPGASTGPPHRASAVSVS